MKVAALAGGIGAGKFLRGLTRVVPGEDLTVVVNVGDDLVIHGLHVSPDPDSVTYWLGDAFDRERGWGRRDETFRAVEELAAFDRDAAWFALGDVDLATHLFRTGLLAAGVPFSVVTARIGRRFGIGARLLPASDDRIETRIDAVDHGTGEPLDLHFQDYWVRRHAVDPVKGVRYLGAGEAAPAPGVLEALADADAIVFCPSNPVVSIGPILAVPGIRAAGDDAPLALGHDLLGQDDDVAAARAERAKRALQHRGEVVARTDDRKPLHGDDLDAHRASLTSRGRGRSARRPRHDRRRS